MERAVHFYRDTLGLSLKFQTAEYSEFATSGAVLALEKRNQVVGNGPCFTFSSSDIDSDRTKLRSMHVNFWKDLQQESYGRVMMPQDSEGNIFEIVQYR